MSIPTILVIIMAVLIIGGFVIEGIQNVIYNIKKKRENKNYAKKIERFRSDFDKPGQKN